MLLIPDTRVKLVSLKDFAYDDPGMDYPAWKRDACRHLKTRIVDVLVTWRTPKTGLACGMSPQCCGNATVSGIAYIEPLPVKLSVLWRL